MKKIILSVLIATTIMSAQIWTRNGPYSAHVISLAVAPSDSNVIFIGTYCDGVYKSVDGAETWLKCSTENLPQWEDSLYNSPNTPCWWFGDYYPVNDIAIDSGNSEHLWIGFGGRGLFESSDGGNSWQRTGAGLPDSLDVDFIHLNHNDTNKLFVGSGNHNYNENQPLENGGLYYTEDGGNNWALADSVPHGSSYNISSISIEPENEDHIFVGVGSAGEYDFSWGLFESTDGGLNWEIKSQDEYTFYDISVNPTNNQNIFSIIYTGYLDWYLAESEDGGVTWAPDYTENWVTSLYADKQYNLYAAEGWENELDGNVKKSVDGGTSWEYIDTLCAGRGVSLRNRCETNNSNVDNIYFGTYCGTYKSNDGGKNSELKNINIFNSYIQDIEIHPSDNNIVYAGGYQGLWKTSDGCETWDQVSHEGVYVIRYDRTTPDTLYYGGQHLKRSFDGGKTFTDIRNGVIGFIVDIKINPLNTNVLYVVGEYYGYFIFKSEDYGDTWVLLENWEYKHFIDYPFLTMDQNNPDTLYFDTYRTINGGKNWSGAFNIPVIGVNPKNSNIVYCSNRNTIKVSYDWGGTFQDLVTYSNWTAPVPGIVNLIFDKNNPDIMMFCTPNNGIHYSNDSGANWHVLEGSYEKRTLDAILIPELEKIYIATHGDGVWAGEGVTVGIEPDLSGIINNYSLGQNYPNPFNSETRIEYEIDKLSHVELRIYNSKGEFIKNIVDERQKKGRYSVDFNAYNLNTGIYFYRLIIDGGVNESRKMLYLK
jgi:photosystem II stability/assembly factor-like uncharacterized protein